MRLVEEPVAQREASRSMVNSLPLTPSIAPDWTLSAISEPRNHSKKSDQFAGNPGLIFLDALCNFDTRFRGA
jgi:hypothetical protein